MNDQEIQEYLKRRQRPKVQQIPQVVIAPRDGVDIAPLPQPIMPALAPVQFEESRPPEINPQGARNIADLVRPRKTVLASARPTTEEGLGDFFNKTGNKTGAAA